MALQNLCATQFSDFHDHVQAEQLISAVSLAKLTPMLQALFLCADGQDLCESAANLFPPVRYDVARVQLHAS
eukprot:1546260-Pleurochrysis_carterae.AAC.2